MIHATTTSSQSRYVAHCQPRLMVRATGVSVLVQQGRTTQTLAKVEQISMDTAALLGDFSLTPGEHVTLFFRVRGMLPLKASAEVSEVTDKHVTVGFIELEPAMRDMINRVMLAELSANFRSSRDALRIR